MAYDDEFNYTIGTVPETDTPYDATVPVDTTDTTTTYTPPEGSADLTPEQEWAKGWGGLNADGSINWDKFATEDPFKLGTVSGDSPAIDPASIASLAKSLPTDAWNAIKSAFTKKDANGNDVTNWKALAAAGGGIAGLATNLMNKNNPQPITGYQGKIPKYTAVQQQVPGTYDPNRRPGSSGQRYFTDIAYAAPSDVAAAQSAAKEQAAGLAALNADNPAMQKRPVADSQPAAPASSVINRMAPTLEGLAAIKNAQLGRINDTNSQTSDLSQPAAPSKDAPRPIGSGDGQLNMPYEPKVTLPYIPSSGRSLDSILGGLFDPSKRTNIPQVEPSNPSTFDPSVTEPAAQSGGINTLTPANQNVAQPAAPVDLMQYNDWVTSSLNPDTNNTKVDKSNPYFNIGQYQHYGNYLNNAFANAKKNYNNSVDANGALTDPKYIELINNFNKYNQEARDLRNAYQKTVDWNAIPQVAHGGLINYASGGGITALKQGHYLAGPTDGMADKLPANIDGNQEARLSHGEFVIPADVVSHLGNGNSEAGADRLYSMMDKIRKARTGTTKQGKQINPNKFLPGGSVGYAGGGIASFAAGGVTVPANAVGAESNLSNWAGDYVTDMLGKGQALAGTPYQAYTGPLTAGASAGQTAAFQGAAGLNVPTSQMGAFTPQTFTAEQAQNYMNPYLSAALNPQMEEMRRQSQLNLQPNLAKLTQAGGYGGSRQALMQSEAGRNLLQEQNKTLGQGYQTAFDKAMAQFNTEQGRGLEAQTATNAYGLQALQKQADLGAQQREIEQQGITADRAQFEEEKQDPYKKLQFQQSLLSGLPLQAQTNTYQQPSALTSLLGGATTVADLYKILFPDTPAKP
jgi:hypothetical protein